MNNETNLDRIMREGGPAFPRAYLESPEGMSLRDYFAGQLLPACVDMAIQVELSGGSLKRPAPICAAEMAYDIADAMLKVRSNVR